MHTAQEKELDTLAVVKFKKCPRCLDIKFRTHYSLNKSRYDGLAGYCKICTSYLNRTKYKNNKGSAKYTKKYRKKNPWKATLYSIRSRCNNKNVKKYKFYGGKGIKCLVSSEDLKNMWFRDRAYEMKNPSIDRIDSDKHYTAENCRYVEWKTNSKEGRIKRIEKLHR